MTFRTIVLALLVLLVAPSVAEAQRDTRQTREATRFIGLAMGQQDEAQRAGLYRQALEQLREGMAQDPQNAKVWRLAGEALAALGEMQEADEAFRRAVDLHPAYAAEITSERESAWIAAFTRGLELMDNQQYDEAIAVLLSAQVIYAERPEALLNLGALYANAGDTQRAEQALRDAIRATQGPLFEQLDAETKAEWLQHRERATTTIAQVVSQQAIADFQAEQFDSAAVRFARAAETNPQDRNHVFNHAQALWARAAQLERDLEGASGARADEIRAQLAPLYTRIQESADRARTFDPNNEMLYLIGARTQRMIGEISASAADQQAAQQTALRLLEQHAELTVLLDDIAIMHNDDGSPVIVGTLQNVKVPAGSPVTLNFTLLALDGSTVGEHVVTVNAPEPEEETTFEATATATGVVAGWRYTVGG